VPSLIKRYRELIVVSILLLYPLATFLGGGRRAREPNVVDRGVLAVSAPIQRGLGWSIDQVAEGWSSYLALRGVKQQNDELLRENAELRGRVHALFEAESENQRLRGLLAYSEQRVGQEVVARVIGVNPVSNVLSIRLNRGSNHGVHPGGAVITSQGVVGQVIRATGGYADVVLITDGASRLAVRVQRSRARATAAGVGGDQNLRLENLLRTEDLQDGDLIITAGTDGVFPPGLAVGRATAVSRRATGMFQSAEVIPAVDMTRLEEILVLSPLVTGEGGSAATGGGGTP
jgi:rod shape-determining protein MreC